MTWNGYMRSRFAFVAALGLFGVGPYAVDANPLDVGGMRVAWSHRDGAVIFDVSAPTTGWVAVGFNDVDSIIGADLVMMRIVDGALEVQNRFVVATGDHRPVEEIGGVSIVLGVEGELSEGRIGMRVVLDPRGEGSHHYSLAPGSEIVLINAYSVSPDFQHHSRMRRHVRVRL